MRTNTFETVKPNKVFLIDTNKQPLNPITPKQARKLLEKNKAAVWRQYPFTLILKTRIEAPLIYPLTLKIDPGSKFTGISILSENEVIWCAELEHRGYQIKESLTSRNQQRRVRRSKIKYREPRFDNRKREKNWIAPSLLHRVQTTENWVNRFIRFCPITEVWLESVKFDMAKIQNPEISGTEYQQGTSHGYEVREYLLEKWDRKCAYCGKTDIPLEIEHIQPKARGGSNRISNLTLACHCCNQKKAAKPVEEFLAKKPKLLDKIKTQAKKSLRDAAAVNTTRNAIVRMLETTNLPVTKATGAQTKLNRIRLELPKHHWVDAACVGDIDSLVVSANQPLKIKSTGHGTRQYVNPDKYGFPKSHKSQEKVFFGFKTGDIVKAVVTKGKYIGEYFGRIAVRKTGSFKLYAEQTINHVNHKYCKAIHRSDGYSYRF